MPTAPQATTVQAVAVKEQMHNRLRRIEGQVRGIQQMIDDDRDCQEIMQQLNAVLAAMQKAGHHFARAYAKECLLNIDTTPEREREDAIDTLLDLMIKAR